MARPLTTPAAAFLCAALALAPGCRRCGGASAPSGPVHRYTVRGEILKVAPRGAPPELTIRHEAVPDFKDRDGKVVGMSAMTMPFPVRKGVPLEGLEPGDKVSFRFAVDWSGGRMEIESVEELPEDTDLRVTR